MPSQQSDDVPASTADSTTPPQPPPSYVPSPSPSSILSAATVTDPELADAMVVVDGARKSVDIIEEPPAPYTLLQYTSDGAFLTATTAFVRESADGNVNPPEYVPASNNPVARIAAARAAYAERRRRTMEDDRVEVVETGKFLGLPLKAWAVSLALLNFLYGLLITILTILALLPTFPAPTTSSLRPNSGSAIIAVLAVIFALFHLIGVVGIMTRGSRWLGLLRLWSEGGRRWVFLGVVFVVVSTVAIGWWVKVGGAVGVGAVMAGVQMLTAVLGQRYYDSCSKAREAASSIAMV